MFWKWGHTMRSPQSSFRFLHVIDMGGIRHAIRASAITALRDADEDRTEAIVIINGGREAILVASDFETVLEAVIDLG